MSIVLSVSLGASAQKPENVLIYQDKNASIESRVKDLLSRMTLMEKAGQLNQLNGGILTGPGSNETGQQEKVQLIKECVRGR